MASEGKKKNWDVKAGKGREHHRKGEREAVTLHSLSNTVLIIYFCRRRRRRGAAEEGSGRQLLGDVCVWRGGGPRLLMYSHIMLGSDPAAVSKMFEAQNIIFQKCSHRLAILFLERPDIWPFSFSPAPSSTRAWLLPGGSAAGAPSDKPSLHSLYSGFKAGRVQDG